MRNLLVWVLIVATAALVITQFVPHQQDELEESPAALWSIVEKHPEQIAKAYIQDEYVYAELSGKKDADKPDAPPTRYRIRLVSEEDRKAWHDKLMEKLGDRYKGREADSIQWDSWLVTALFWCGLIGLFYFLVIRPMRQAGAGGGGVLSFGKTRARLIRREQSKITFDDVAGMTEAKEEVIEIIEFLKNPQRFQKIGGRMPRGVLFVGPPGTGKTLLAKAIAGEADVPFFSISGSDFVEMFVGVGASRVRDLFRQAKQNSPCIIFLDEIDAVGRKRGTGFSGAHDEREQTLNAILVEMDGFDTNDQVIVIAATNRVDVLDPALRRPGRFDREVSINLPDINEREAVLKVHVRNIRMDPSIDLKVIARGTPGFSGADLAALVNEAALAATMHEKECVELADMEEARDKVRWGRSRRSRAMDEQEKRTTAIHEAGHALLTVLLEPDAEPLHKVTIIPRGLSMGATMFLPEKDRYLITRKQCLASIMVSFGGRIAEELTGDDISSGASMDIRMATGMARRMVKEWGMSDRLGPLNYVTGAEAEDGGAPDIFTARNYSEDTAHEIDEEVKRISDDCYARARQLLTDNRQKLERLAEALLAFEVLDAAEVLRVIEGQGISRPRPPNEMPPVDAAPSTADHASDADPPPAATGVEPNPA
jgi:cell division protease FtsH